MLISRFGSNWATGYVFPELQAVDDWQIQRPSAVSQVSGMAGAFDYVGAAANPQMAITVTKKFELAWRNDYVAGAGTIYTGTQGTKAIYGLGTAFQSFCYAGDKIRFTFNDHLYEYDIEQVFSATWMKLPDPQTASLPSIGSGSAVGYLIAHPDAYLNVENALEVLKRSVVAVGESKLWGLLRNGDHRWAWAKPIRGKYPESYVNKLHLPVELDFYLREGLWYGETQSGTSLSNSMSYPLTLTNAGNMPAAVVLQITPSGTLTSLTLTNGTNGNTCTWTGSATSGQLLKIDTGNWLVTKAGAGAYEGFTFGAGQENWLTLLPGDNAITVSVAGASGWSGSLTWWNTYL
jgi:hypothetical protein